LWKRWKWRGLALPFIKRATAEPWVGALSFTPEEKLSVKRPELKTSGEEAAAFGIPVSKLLGKLDRVNDVLTSGAWEDNAVKGQRCLMLFIEGGTVKVLLKVEHPCLKLSAAGRSIDEALVALDALLGAAETPWEADIPRDKKGAKKGR